MAYRDQKRIMLSDSFEHVENKMASTDVYPGMLLELNSDDKVIPHNEADEIAVGLFALEDALQGNTVSDVYEEDNPVSIGIPRKGCRVWALVTDDETYAPGDYLASNGDGALKKVTATGSEYKLAQVIEDLEVESGAGNTHIQVRVV